MSWTVSPVRAETIPAMWLAVLPLLAPAIDLSGGRLSARSVLDWLRDGRYLLWIAHEEDGEPQAAFVSRIAQYPCKRMLTIDLAGGRDSAGWVETANEVFRSYSRQAGCNGDVELAGRQGWTRALRAVGWRQTAVIVETTFTTGGAAV